MSRAISLKILDQARKKTQGSVISELYSRSSTDPLKIRDSIEESILSSSSKNFPFLGRCSDVQRVGRLFEEYLLPIIQNDSSKKKKTFVSVCKYLIALISNVEPSERWVSDLENEQIPPDFENERLPPGLWEICERETRSPFKWAEIFNKTAQFRKSTFSPKMTKAIQNQFSLFVSVLRSKLTPEKRIFLKLALDAIEYLENHEIDPGNLFVGTPPSDFVSKALVPIIQTTTNPSSPSSPSSSSSFSSTPSKNEMDLQKQIMRWKALKNHPEQIEEEINQTVQHLLETQPKGMVGLVAVRISSIPQPYQSWFTNPQWAEFSLWEFVYCRLAEPVVSSTVASVFVYLDPWETFCVEVPIDSVFHFEGKTSDIPFYEETKPTNVMFFSNPIFYFQRKLAQCIGDKVSSYFDEKYPKKSVCLTSELGKLDELFDFNAKLEILECSLSEDSASRSLLNEEVCEMLVQKNREWATSIPCGLFFPPKLEIALDEITDFLEKIPTTIKKEISIISKHTKTLVRRYAKMIQSVLNGQRKREMCDWWLSHIEKKADQYLKDCGYGHDVIPENYTKEKPKDLDSLKKNLSIVQDLIEGESEELDNFVDETTLEVYEMLEKLLHEIEFVLQRKWTKMNLEVEYTEVDIESLKKDYDYLMKVKEMDLELKEKRKQKVREKEPLRISEVVPVSGLVMARFHIFRAECQTSLMIWEKKMSRSKIQIATRSAWRMSIFENARQTHEKPNLFEFCGSADELSLADSIADSSDSVELDDDETWCEIDRTSSESPAKDWGDDSRSRKSSASWKKIEPSPQMTAISPNSPCHQILQTEPTAVPSFPKTPKSFSTLSHKKVPSFNKTKTLGDVNRSTPPHNGPISPLRERGFSKPEPNLQNDRCKPFVEGEEVSPKLRNFVNRDPRDWKKIGPSPLDDRSKGSLLHFPSSRTPTNPQEITQNQKTFVPLSHSPIKNPVQSTSCTMKNSFPPSSTPPSTTLHSAPGKSFQIPQTFEPTHQAAPSFHTTTRKSESFRLISPSFSSLERTQGPPPLPKSTAPSSFVRELESSQLSNEQNSPIRFPPTPLALLEERTSPKTFSPQTTISKNLLRKSCQFSPTTGPTTSQLTIPSSIRQKSLSSLRKGTSSSSEPFGNHRQANKGPTLSLSTSPSQQRKSLLSSHSSSPSSPSFTPSSLSLHRSDALAIPKKNPRNKNPLSDKQKKEREKGKREENEERVIFEGDG